MFDASILASPCKGRQDAYLIKYAAIFRQFKQETGLVLILCGDEVGYVLKKQFPRKQLAASGGMCLF